MKSARRRRLRWGGCVLAAVALTVAASATPAAALELTTPYPVVVVEPGQDVTLDLDVRSPSRGPVRLGVSHLPTRWRAFLHGGATGSRRSTRAPTPPTSSSRSRSRTGRARATTAWW